MITIYDRNDSGQYYKTMILANYIHYGLVNYGKWTYFIVSY
jgi:hypothetical protein